MLCGVTGDKYMKPKTLTEHEYDFVMEAIEATAKTGTDQDYLEEIQAKITALDEYCKQSN